MVLECRRSGLGVLRHTLRRGVAEAGDPRAVRGVGLGFSQPAGGNGALTAASMLPTGCQPPQASAEGSADMRRVLLRIRSALLVLLSGTALLPAGAPRAAVCGVGM